MNPHDLIILARALANLAVSDAYLRKAVSAGYYAMFHAVCKGIADIWYWEDELSRHGADWNHMYRGANHNAILRACKNVKLIALLSPEIQLFCKVFIFAHTDRNSADYDSLETFEQESVLYFIDRVEEAVLAFENADVAQRRAFLSRIVYPERKL